MKEKLDDDHSLGSKDYLCSHFVFQQRFVDNFEAEQVGILEVAYMTEERLQGLGIPLGPRLRIMEEVKKFALEHTKKVR